MYTQGKRTGSTTISTSAALRGENPAGTRKHRYQKRRRRATAKASRKRKQGAAMNTELPAIVKRALVETITDIGQLSASDKFILNRYVKRGWLSRGKGGPFPILKTVYACPGFDFTASRARYVEAAMEAYRIEQRLRASGYFDLGSPNYGVSLSEQRERVIEQ